MPSGSPASTENRILLTHLTPTPPLLLNRRRPADKELERDRLRRSGRVACRRRGTRGAGGPAGCRLTEQRSGTGKRHPPRRRGAGRNRAARAGFHRLMHTRELGPVRQADEVTVTAGELSGAAGEEAIPSPVSSPKLTVFSGNGTVGGGRLRVVRFGPAPTHPVLASPSRAPDRDGARVRFPPERGAPGSNLVRTPCLVAKF